jgi:hypothetical protein
MVKPSNGEMATELKNTGERMKTEGGKNKGPETSEVTGA